MKSTVTDRGQVSIPAALRREMHLVSGRTVIWEKISETECRVLVAPVRKANPDPIAALNFARDHGLESMRSDEWMQILREGEMD